MGRPTTAGTVALMCCHSCPTVALIGTTSRSGGRSSASPTLLLRQPAPRTAHTGTARGRGRRTFARKRNLDGGGVWRAGLDRGQQFRWPSCPDPVRPTTTLRHMHTASRTLAQTTYGRRPRRMVVPRLRVATQVPTQLRARVQQQAQGQRAQAQRRLWPTRRVPAPFPAAPPRSAFEACPDPRRRRYGPGHRRIARPGKSASVPAVRTPPRERLTKHT
jgi:hypothetical protein